jgi:hypothetical protein
MIFRRTREEWRLMKGVYLDSKKLTPLDMTLESVADFRGSGVFRHRRAIRRRALVAQGITPSNRQEVWRLELRYLKSVPDRFQKHAIKGLSAPPGVIWLPRPLGRSLFNIDARQSNILKTEFKRCLMCYRPLIGNEAEVYRKMLESSPGARKNPCGPRCAEERESKLWKRLAV